MRIGDTFETADCEGCGGRIKHEFWGNGGTIWKHLNGSVYCADVPHARPRPNSVHPVTSDE